MYLSNSSSFFFLSHLIMLISDDSKYSKYYMKIVVLKYLYLVLKKNDLDLWQRNGRHDIV